MSARFETDVHRVVHDNESGLNVNVMPDRDHAGLLAVEGGDEFGKIALPPEMAVEVANAMLACALEMMTDRISSGGNETQHSASSLRSAETNGATEERVIVTLRAISDKFGMTVAGIKYRVNQRVLTGEWRILPRKSNLETVYVEMPASDWEAAPPAKWSRS